MADSEGGDIRARLLEASRDPEAVGTLIHAILTGTTDAKGLPKSADAIKVFELLCRLQAEDAANAPDLEGLDLSAYSDEELRAMLVRLADGGTELPEVSAPVPPPAGGGLSADRRRAETPPDQIRIRLEDFL